MPASAQPDCPQNQYIYTAQPHPERILPRRLYLRARRAKPRISIHTPNTSVPCVRPSVAPHPHHPSRRCRTHRGPRDVPLRAPSHTHTHKADNICWLLAMHKFIDGNAGRACDPIVLVAWRRGPRWAKRKSNVRACGLMDWIVRCDTRGERMSLASPGMPNQSKSNITQAQQAICDGGERFSGE